MNIHHSYVNNLKSGDNSDTIYVMDSLHDIIIRLEKSPNNVRYSELSRICDRFFGEPRQNSSSHKIYKPPWVGDPRINIQDKNGKAKAYQVRQVVKALKRLEVQYGSSE